jgi:hypothetical protein
MGIFARKWTSAMSLGSGLGGVPVAEMITPRWAFRGGGPIDVTPLI